MVGEDSGYRALSLRLDLGERERRLWEALGTTKSIRTGWVRTLFEVGTAQPCVWMWM